MRLTIRHQLLLPLLTLMAGVVVLSAWIAWSAAERTRRRIESQLDGVAESVSAVTFPLNMQTLRLMKGMSGADFLVCDSHRQPLINDEGQPLTTLPSVPLDLPEAAPRERLHLAPRIQVAGTTYFCQGVALHRDVSANRMVYLCYPETLWEEAITQAIHPALIVGGIGGFISIALTLLATQRITHRLRQLVKRTRLIADGDFSPMPLSPRRDELRDLGQAINEMAGRLAQYQETLRTSERLRLLGQVSGGIAHQLRNGVAGARLAVQLYTRSAPAAEELAVALRQLALVELQLKRFLDLGKETELQREECDLTALLEETLVLVRPRCEHARISLRWQKPSAPVRLSADAHQLRQVFLNLLTNAIEAAGPGGWVETRVGDEEDAAFVEILDSGSGPDAAVAPRLFEPFVTARPEGVGLGLAVAKQIVKAHGGQIRWERRGGATCFRLELPRSSKN
jgi:signal transduction histidine kinase